MRRCIVNAGAPALQGAGLEMLARQYMEVQAIIKRWTRRYDERLLEQLIYMPEVTAADFDRADWMRDWARDLQRSSSMRSTTARAAIAWTVASACDDASARACMVSKTEHGSRHGQVAAARVLRVRGIPAHRRAGQDARRH